MLDATLRTADTGQAMSNEATSWIALAVVVGVVLVSGCEGGSPNERAIENTVDTFVDAIGHDGERACLQLSREAQAELKRLEDASSCELAAESFSQPVVVMADFDAIRFGPDNESAIVPSGIDPEEFPQLRLGSTGFADIFPPIPLEEGDGRWRITGLDWFFEW